MLECSVKASDRSAHQVLSSLCVFLCVCFPLNSTAPSVRQLPDLVNQLGVLYHMIESRVKTFHKLTRLHGKLYLLMTQVGRRYCVIGRNELHALPDASGRGHTSFGYFVYNT